MSAPLFKSGSPMYVEYLQMRASIARGVRNGIIVTTVDADILALAQSVKGSVSRNVDKIHAMLCTDACEKHYGRCFSNESHNPALVAEVAAMKVMKRRAAKRSCSYRPHNCGWDGHYYSCQK